MHALLKRSPVGARCSGSPAQIAALCACYYEHDRVIADDDGDDVVVGVFDDSDGR